MLCIDIPLCHCCNGVRLLYSCAVIMRSTKQATITRDRVILAIHLVIDHCVKDYAVLFDNINKKCMMNCKRFQNSFNESILKKVFDKWRFPAATRIYVDYHHDSSPSFLANNFNPGHSIHKHTDRNQGPSRSCDVSIHIITTIYTSSRVVFIKRKTLT